MLLQADEPDRAAHPGFGGGGDSTSAGEFSPEVDDEDGFLLLRGDEQGADYEDGFLLLPGDEHGAAADDEEYDYRLDVDDGGEEGGGGEGDDDLSISVDQLFKFLDEPIDDAPPMLPEEPEPAAPPAESDAAQAPASSSSPSIIEYLPSCSSASNDINANKAFHPQKVSYYAGDPGYMEASLHGQINGLEGSLGTHETDTCLTEEHPMDLNDYDPHIPLDSNNMSNDNGHGLPSGYLKFSSPEYFMQHTTGVTSVPSISRPVNPPFGEILSNGIVGKHGSIDETGNFLGYMNQNGTNMGTASMPGFGRSSQILSFETDVDTKLSMNFSSVNIRKNGTTGHYMMPQKHDFTFGFHDNVSNNGSQCSTTGSLPHSAFPNILNGKLNNSTNVKLENNGSHLVENIVNGVSSSVSSQDLSYFKPVLRADFCRGVERVGQPCGSESFFIKDKPVQTVKKEPLKAHYPDLPIIDLDDSITDPLCNQGITYVTSTESSPNHILGEEYYGFKNDGQSLNSRVDFMLQSNSILPECSSKHSIPGFDMNSLWKNRLVDEDDEVHIVDDSGGPHNPSITVLPSSCSKTRSGFSSYDYPEEFPLESKTHSEKITFQIALQDLTQPMSESSPPDGVLAVPLLRHQRIALSWMVQKETSNQNCSGGILADDQGLGKTVSTIALILSERSPSVKSCEQVARQVEVETLSSDDEDLPPINGKSKAGKFECEKSKKLMVDNDLALPVQGRPAAGTLVVCPTSVLRQWADEIQNKVTSKGNLSILVYHGANRTKDPSELAKYDVVLTTYSIVSMEVPKQVVNDKDDEEKAKQVHHDSMETSASRKRKHPSVKIKKTADNSIIEAFVRPLAKVAWFRVILDEAQTIKNHRTLVAKACCGLRAKRRWCLSGTPIQNTIDDLYSYFRFLRYEPYAVYSSFCSNIKHPINKNPAIGYRKLQAVLKTILLRRTKGTFLDGEPIIKLPLKSVELKRLDFSMEERTFYDNLEAESRAQFKAYADAGTVKENYVNILLMLLRLRQACDHPVLVQGSDSSVLPGEIVKQLSRDKCLDLLNCLEASQAICTICNDPPEDAVVSVCGHVFCNQCVSEHLTGDIRQCPTAQCKVKLNATSIFTKASLKSSIDDLPKVDISTGSCVNKESSEPKTDIFSSDSSKIKAAMDILLSLPILELCSKHISSFDNSDVPSKRHDNANTVQVNDTCNTFLKKAEARCFCVQECLCGRKTEKALVFSQWTRMLDLLETRLKSSCIQYRRLDGTMSIADRDKAVKEFNTVPEVTVMIMSLKAASLGLNLVSACHVILLDLWWNPTTEDQAVDRAHRIGQTRPVTVMRLTVKDTVEDRILALQEKKRVMVASAFGEDEKGSRQSRLTVDDLKYLFMM